MGRRELPAHFLDTAGSRGLRMSFAKFEGRSNSDFREISPEIWSLGP